MTPTVATPLVTIASRARRLYAARVANMPSSTPWWTAVILTASSKRQADRYEWEIQRRRHDGKLPSGVTYLVVPDVEDRRIGSGGATLNALRALTRDVPSPDAAWWQKQRVLMIHAGGDSRRLPQYSLSGKLFSAVPVATPWGEPSSVFDEMMALSSDWVEHLPNGLVVGSGDVILTFDGTAVHWSRPGVSGVAMLQPAVSGTQHGVYVTDEGGRIYSFLQKPSLSEMKAAGGLTHEDEAALDTGLLRFAPETAARMTELAAAIEGPHPAIDLYEHVTMGLTGQWSPGPHEHPALHELARALEGVPFWCSVVRGDFTHIGTTALFRRLMTEESALLDAYAGQQRLGASRQPGVRSAGVVIDSVFSGGADLGAGTVAIECHVEGAVRAAAGSVLHGLDGIAGSIDIPEDTVVHQLPVELAAGRRGVVIRAYGVLDDAKVLVARGKATWFGRPLLEELDSLGLSTEKVWPGIPREEWTLWNAHLFPVTGVAEAWECARWMMHLPGAYSAERWHACELLSLAAGAQYADGAALDAARARRLKATWRILALSLVESGADIRPLLANAPGIRALSETGAALKLQAGEMEDRAPTESASRYYAAGMFFGQAGLMEHADAARAAAFGMVERAVQSGSYDRDYAAQSVWACGEVAVEGPARIDLGGGWSDTPPFCLDWGGTVLNVAITLNGEHPIRSVVKRVNDPIVRCIAGDDGQVAEYRSCTELHQAPNPGDPFSIPRAALCMTGLFPAGADLEKVLRRMGGGIEIRTAVALPMGSGLGTSSILAATVLRGLNAMLGLELGDQLLSEQVMRLEQQMTTGGGWQDQAGGIFPGAKLAVTGPGLHQRIRVQPVAWSVQRQTEFEQRIVLYYTGIQRVARDLLQQVVGRYLARETACLQVLHSIKTLAMEMMYAMQEGEWQHLGELLDRHWELNKTLDPATANAPINALLEKARPFIHGAKLAGAGGGGFLIMVARSGEAAEELKEFLGKQEGAVFQWKVASEAMRSRRISGR